MTQLNLYWTAPQKENKAAKEIRQAGYRAYVPKQRRANGKGFEPTARSYIAAPAKPSRIGGRFDAVRDERGDIIGLRENGSVMTEAKHVGRCIGPVSRSDLARLYIRESKTQRQHAFKPGDKVLIDNGEAFHDVPAEIAGIVRHGWYEVAVNLMGKRCLTKVSEQHIRRQNLHPPT